MSASSTQTSTTVVTGTHKVEKVLLRMMGTEICTIWRAVIDCDPPPWLRQALLDCAIGALYGLISRVRLQIAHEGELVGEYIWTLANEQLEPAGPPPDQPPLRPFRAGAKPDLMVTMVPGAPKDLVDTVFEKWSPASPLCPPDGAEYRVFGSHVCEGFGVLRQVLEFPSHHQPQAEQAREFGRKDGK